MKTKDKILNTALELFNQEGVSNVSTNHVAGTAGISPGNLYYHFKNKEEIIRELFDGMLAEEIRICGEFKCETPEDMDDYFKKLLGIYQRFLFFKRDAVLLVKADEVLLKKFQEYQEQQSRETITALRLFSERGLISPLSEESLELLSHNINILLLFWLPYSELLHKTPYRQPPLEEGIDMIRNIINLLAR